MNRTHHTFAFDRHGDPWVAVTSPQTAEPPYLGGAVLATYRDESSVVSWSFLPVARPVFLGRRRDRNTLVLATDGGDLTFTANATSVDHLAHVAWLAVRAAIQSGAWADAHRVWFPGPVVAAHALPPEFTASELRRVYQAFGPGPDLDPSNFRKSVERWERDGYFTTTGGKIPTKTRPARAYQIDWSRAGEWAR